MWPLLIGLLTSTELDVDSVLEQLEALRHERTGTRAVLVEGYALVRGTTLEYDPRLTLDTDAAGAWNADSLYELQPRRTRPGYVLGLYGEGELRSGVAVRVLLDSGEINAASDLEPPLAGEVVAVDGRTLEDQFASGAFVREAALVLGHRGLSLELGRRRTTLASGLLYDDFATGAAATISAPGLGARAPKLDLTVVVVGHTLDELRQASPLLVAEIGFAPSLFQSVSVFGAYLVDRASLLDGVMQSVAAERVIAALATTPLVLDAVLTQLFLTSSAESPNSMGYVGINVDLVPLRGTRLRLNGVLSRGRINLAAPVAPDASAVTLHFALRGFAVAGELSYALTSHLRLAGVGFALSGDNAPRLTETTSTTPGELRRDLIDYRGYVAISPYWSWSGLFFSGGLGHALWPGRASAAGVNGHGVAGGGPLLELEGDAGRFALRAVYLGALATTSTASASPGWIYGVEIDALGEWHATSWLTAALEVDLLPLGNYFPEQQLAWRALGQLYVHFGR